MNTVYKRGLSIMCSFIALYSFSLLCFADETVVPVDVVTPDPVSIPTVSVDLDIEVTSGSLFHGVLAVTPCAPSPTAAEEITAYCAIKQTGLSNTWSTFGDDFFLDSVGDTATDSNAGLYWNWFSNLTYGTTSLNKHILVDGEHILVTLGVMPTKIVVATTTPVVDSTLVVEGYQFGFDTSWNPAWLPRSGGTLVIDTTEHVFDEGGKYTMTTPSASFTIQSTAVSGFLASDSISITPQQGETTLSGSSNGGGGGVIVVHHTPDSAAALAFLLSKQYADGSFGSTLYTDWAAIALCSSSIPNDAKSRLISSLKNTSSEYTSATDYERHSMALLACGINPYTDTSTNYIAKLTTFFDGVQMGNSNLINDDIFALFPLLKAGYTSDDAMIRSIVSTIVNAQDSAGSWNGSADMTAAGIGALSLVPALPSVSDSLSRAKQYLHTVQGANGGFGSSFSTSWALQAIASVGESPTVWINPTYTPFDSLYTLQDTDGGIEKNTESEENRIWATSYAIPALFGKSWNSILTSVSKYTAPVENGGGTLSVTKDTSIPKEASIPVVQPIITIPIAAAVTPIVKQEVVHSTTDAPQTEQTVPVVQSSLQEARAGATQSAMPIGVLMRNAFVALCTSGGMLLMYKIIKR